MSGNSSMEYLTRVDQVAILMVKGLFGDCASDAGRVASRDQPDIINAEQFVKEIKEHHRHVRDAFNKDQKKAGLPPVKKGYDLSYSKFFNFIEINFILDAREIATS